MTVTVEATRTAVRASYEGSVVLVSRATGMRLHIPVWLRVLPPVDRDVLLIDDDGSPGGGRGRTIGARTRRCSTRSG